MGEQVAAGLHYGGVAQLGEHLPCKQGVKSSNLSIATQVKEKRETVRTGTCSKECTLKTEYEDLISKSKG